MPFISEVLIFNKFVTNLLVQHTHRRDSSLEAVAPYPHDIHNLFMWDAFRAHMIARITGRIWQEYNSDMAVIPGGCTSKLQPADLSWNKELYNEGSSQEELI